MSQRLTEQQIRLLSTYLDGEATIAERKEAEELLRQSGSARTWYSDVQGRQSLSRTSAESVRATAASLSSSSKLTGSSIVAASRGSLLPFPLAKIAGIASLVVALGSALYLTPSVDSRSGPEAGQIAAIVPPAEYRLPDVVSPDGVIPETTEIPEQEASPADRRRVAVAARSTSGQDNGMGIVPSNPVDSAETASTPAWQTVADAPYMSDLTIILTTTNATIILSNDISGDQSLGVLPLESRDEGEEFDRISMTISRLTDTLNGRIARIVVDTNQTPRARARMIIEEQLRYRQTIEQLINRIPVQPDTLQQKPSPEPRPDKFSVDDRGSFNPDVSQTDMKVTGEEPVAFLSSESAVADSLS